MVDRDPEGKTQCRLVLSFSWCRFSFFPFNSAAGAGWCGEQLDADGELSLAVDGYQVWDGAVWRWLDHVLSVTATVMVTVDESLLSTLRLPKGRATRRRKEHTSKRQWRYSGTRDQAWID